MQSAVLCYAAPDWEPASEIAVYLEQNCPGIAFDLEEFASPTRILDAAGCALSADFPVLLLSPSAVPQSFPRAVWQPILVDEAARFERQIAYVLLRPCKFPEVFRRGAFFDVSQDFLPSLRKLKRWLLRHAAFFQRVIDLPESPVSVAGTAALETLARRISDRPGIETGVSRETALAFAHASLPDFEGIFWLDGARRNWTGIAGDAGHVLGMRLRGPADGNARALCEICTRRRILFVFEHATPERAPWAAPGGKASFLFVAESAPAPPLALRDATALFASWQTDPAPCFRVLGDAAYHIGRLHEYRGGEWQTALSLGAAVCSFLKQGGRLAEVCELLETMTAALRSRGLSFESARLEWEKSWILEEWGQPVPPRLEPAVRSEQLALFP